MVTKLLSEKKEELFSNGKIYLSYYFCAIILVKGGKRMKKNLLLIITYIITVILLTLTMFDPEENIMPDVFMAVLTALIYIVFTIGWIKLVQQIKYKTLHKWILVAITWFALLTIGEILFVQSTKIIIIELGMLVCILTYIYIYRTNKMVVDALTAALLFVIAYIAMRFEHTIFPGGVIGGIVISMPFLILGAKKSLRVTQMVARLVFFLMALTILFFVPATPIIAEGGYMLYGLITLIIVAFLIRRKIELLLPNEAMPVLLVVTVVMYVVKLI